MNELENSSLLKSRKGFAVRVAAGRHRGAPCRWKPLGARLSHDASSEVPPHPSWLRRPGPAHGYVEPKVPAPTGTGAGTGAGAGIFYSTKFVLYIDTRKGDVKGQSTNGLTFSCENKQEIFFCSFL